MLKFSSTGATLAKFTLGLTMAATLAACGGGGDAFECECSEGYSADGFGGCGFCGDGIIALNEECDTGSTTSPVKRPGQHL